MSGWTIAGLVVVAVVVVANVFILLGAAWNREGDEADRRLFDRHRDNENPEDQT